MRFIRPVLILTAIAALWGQPKLTVRVPLGIPAKASATDYDAHGDAGHIQIGATFMGRSLAALPPDSKQTALYDAATFLVVEVAVFSAKEFHGDLKASDFQLRIDGQKPAPAPPGLVAATLRANASAEQQRRQTVQFGPPIVQDVKYSEWDAAIEGALPDGPLQSSRAGNLYFAFPGKMAKVKSIVLDYTGDGGTLALKLR